MIHLHGRRVDRGRRRALGLVKRDGTRQPLQDLDTRSDWHSRRLGRLLGLLLRLRPVARRRGRPALTGTLLRGRGHRLGRSRPLGALPLPALVGWQGHSCRLHQAWQRSRWSRR